MHEISSDCHSDCHSIPVLPNVMSTQPKFSITLCRFRAVIGVCVVGALSTACGLTSPSRAEFVISVDSIVVGVTGDPAGLVPVRFFGLVGSSGCQVLKRVEKSASGDSLRLRFVGERRGGNCTQMPIQLRHEELLASLPARRVTVVVEQPHGAQLSRTVVLPLP